MRDTYFLQPTPIGEHHNFMDYNGRILGVSEDINPGFPESISIQDYMDRESDTYKEIEKIKEKYKEEIERRESFGKLG